MVAAGNLNRNVPLVPSNSRELSRRRAIYLLGRRRLYATDAGLNDRLVAPIDEPAFNVPFVNVLIDSVGQSPNVDAVPGSTATSAHA
jgi:hypothetical protein